MFCDCRLARLAAWLGLIDLLKVTQIPLFRGPLPQKGGVKRIRTNDAAEKDHYTAYWIKTWCALRRSWPNLLECSVVGGERERERQRERICPYFRKQIGHNLVCTISAGDEVRRRGLKKREEVRVLEEVKDDLCSFPLVFQGTF